MHAELFAGRDIYFLVGDLLPSPVVEAAQQQQVEEYERKRDGCDAGQRPDSLPAADAQSDFPQDFSRRPAGGIGVAFPASPFRTEAMSLSINSEAACCPEGVFR